MYNHLASGSSSPTMTMSPVGTLDSSMQQPLQQFKGEILDFDLGGLEVDHRKRRRNRTTQSCLNCHTSKRKCDRKRPCQRCIQLGLTGLCVYEVDDPALRDDPNMDENTRLRNRIAELESLVRELRGKPHPRWAEPNFCDGDATEKWHSRSSRRIQPQYQKLARDRHDDCHASNSVSVLSPVKAEQPTEVPQQNLYRFTSSPLPHGDPTDGSVMSYGITRGQQPSQNSHAQCLPDDSCYSSPSSGSSLGFSDTRHAASSAVLTAGEHYYSQQYVRPYANDTVPVQPTCACVTNPAAGNPLIALTNQLQHTIALLRQLPEHNTRHNCLILRRVMELNDIMHGNSTQDVAASSYEALSTPPESELLSPISTSSHSSMATSIHEWPQIAAPNAYDSYFPVSAGEQGVFHKTYHIN